MTTMTVLELKLAASRLKAKDLRELQVHLMRLRRQTPEWKKSMAKKLDAVSAGRFIAAEALESKLKR